jgi:heat-inducible transcriptional repressor
MPSENFLSDRRCSEIFRELVEEYIETGEPVGSRTISKRMAHPLSPATIRNVMADLEELGILCSEHSSAGRRPTAKGLRYFVNTFIEVSGDLQSCYAEYMQNIGGVAQSGDPASILERVSETLSQLSSCTSLILAPTTNHAIVQHIEFLLLSSDKVLVVIVMIDGIVENRIIKIPSSISETSLIKSSNYLNSKIKGMTMAEIREFVDGELELEETSKEVILKGIDVLSVNADDCSRVIIKGHSNLLAQTEKIENIKKIFETLEEKRVIKSLLDEVISGQGIQVFIGSENKSFDLSGCSMIVAPFANHDKEIVGAIGVIGPERMEYKKLINLVDHTAKVLEKLIYNE